MFLVIVNAAAIHGTTPNGVVYEVVAFLVGYREATFRSLIQRATDVLLSPGDKGALPIAHGTSAAGTTPRSLAGRSRSGAPCWRRSPPAAHRASQRAPGRRADDRLCRVAPPSREPNRASARSEQERSGFLRARQGVRVPLLLFIAPLPAVHLQGVSVCSKAALRSSTPAPCNRQLTRLLPRAEMMCSEAADPIAAEGGGFS